jgi:hypothetical protein
VHEFVGNSGAFEKLLPGESVEGCVVFKIPVDATPIEISLVYVPPLMEYG